MISDTDMALFVTIDQLLSDNSNSQKASSEYLLKKLKSSSSNGVVGIGQLGINSEKESSIHGQLEIKDKKDTQRATNIKLESVFF